MVSDTRAGEMVFSFTSRPTTGDNLMEGLDDDENVLVTEIEIEHWPGANQAIELSIEDNDLDGGSPVFTSRDSVAYEYLAAGDEYHIGGDGPIAEFRDGFYCNITETDSNNSLDVDPVVTVRGYYITP